MYFIEEIKEVVDLTPEDATRMVEAFAWVEPHFEEIVGAFYDAFYLNPRTRIYFEDEAQIERLKRSLNTWLHELFSGKYDDAYYRKRLHIGHVHMKIGLLPHFVSAATTIIRSHLATILTDQGMTEHVRAMERMIDIELSIMLQTYWDDLMEQKLKMPVALAMGLAHELRNPLNGMSLNLTLLERRLRHIEGASDLEPSIEVMRHELRRITTMTNEIMDFAKPIDIHPRWVSAHNVLRDLASVHSLTLDAARISLDVRVEGPDLLYIDTDRMHQVLTNLITNAAEAIEQDGSISIHVTNTDRTTSIELIDDGPGMDPSLKYRVFELFYTTKTTGTGLGLAIVRKIIEAHNGTVDVNTRRGQGTQFSIVLPRHHAPESTS